MILTRALKWVVALLLIACTLLYIIRSFNSTSEKLSLTRNTNLREAVWISDLSGGYGGANADQPSGQNVGLVPRFVFQTYFDKSYIPACVFENINKFAPDFHHVVFDDSEIEQFLSDFYGPDNLLKYQKIGSKAHRADVFRYGMMYLFGGVYLDIKTELLAPFFEPLVLKANITYTVKSYNRDFGMYQGVIVTPPNNKIFLDLFYHLLNSAPNQISANYFLSTQQTYRLILNDTLSHEGDNLPDGFIRGRHEFNYFLFSERKFPGQCPTPLDRYNACMYIYTNNRIVAKVRYHNFLHWNSTDAYTHFTPLSYAEWRHHFGRNTFVSNSKLREETKYLEKIGGLYYEAQKVERSKVVHNDFLKVRSNFPCIYGVYPIGDDGRGSINDGHKFACGIKAISGPPIVYSFGSHMQFDFELAVLKLRPDAIIFTFEIDKAQVPSIKPHPSITVLPIGLGGYDNKHEVPNADVMTMRQMMKKLGHTYLDILKMDIEGYEISFVNYESDILRNVGQFLVEFHVLNGLEKLLPPGSISNLLQAFPTFTYANFIDILEKFGLRVFHQEVNKFFPEVGVETSLIQKEWLSWDKNKHSFRI